MDTHSLAKILLDKPNTEISVTINFPPAYDGHEVAPSFGPVYSRERARSINQNLPKKS